MRWYEDLYVGETISHKKKKIKWKIMHNAGLLRVFIITLASNPDNLMDIIPARELKQKHYPKGGLYIIGLAGNYDEALEVAGHIVSEVYTATKGFDVRKYLQHKGSRSL